ncbi:unnamed protein product [Alopecurus aequalis]
MGSLMAGWSSHVLDDHHKVRCMRNRSLTKRDVEAFWRQQKKPVEVDDNAGENIGVTSPPVASSPRSERPRCHVWSLPREMTGTDGDGDTPASPSASRDWWTRSSWAFLNMPASPERAGGGVGQGAAV